MSSKICISKKYGFYLFGIIGLSVFVLTYTYIVGRTSYNSRIVRSNATTPNQKIAPKNIQYIIGGTSVTDITKWPFIVGIYVNKSLLYSFDFCTGTLIDPSWVLTAGHCVTYLKNSIPIQYDPKNVLVSVGTKDSGSVLRDPVNVFMGKKDVKNGVYKIKEIVIPKNFYYYEGSAYNDIALIHLSNTVPTTDETKSISLNRGSQNENELIPGVILGFGHTSKKDKNNNLTVPSPLAEAVIPLISIARANIWRWFSNFKIPTTEIPAGYPLGGVSTCSGDSGGPIIVYDNAMLKWVQVGVTSKSSCGSPRSPAEFTKTSSFLDWIDLYIKNDVKNVCVGNTCSNLSFFNENKGVFVGKANSVNLQEYLCRVMNQGVAPANQTYKCGYEFVNDSLTPTPILPSLAPFVTPTPLP